MNGFTFIECLITIFIFITLLTIGVPAYQHFIARNKVAAYVNELVATIHYAQSVALKEHVPVTICKSADGKSCSGAWRDGWLIFLNADNQLQPTDITQIIRVSGSLPVGDQLIWRASLGKNERLQFNALGQVRQDGSFIYCPMHNTRYATAIVVSLTGRIRLEKQNVDTSLCE